MKRIPVTKPSVTRVADHLAELFGLDREAVQVDRDRNTVGVPASILNMLLNRYEVSR